MCKAYSAWWEGGRGGGGSGPRVVMLGATGTGHLPGVHKHLWWLRDGCSCLALSWDITGMAEPGAASPERSPEPVKAGARPRPTCPPAVPSVRATLILSASQLFRAWSLQPSLCMRTSSPEAHSRQLLLTRDAGTAPLPGYPGSTPVSQAASACRGSALPA